MFRWSRGYICNSSYCHHHIRSINLSPSCHNFPWLCAWSDRIIICCRFHIYPGKAEFCFLYYWAVIWCAQIIEYIIWPDGPFRLFAHYTTSLSSCRRIWRYWTKKLVEYIMSSVCLKLSQFSQLSFMQYTGLCVLILSISLVVIVKIRIRYLIIIIIKSEIWTICHC